MGIFRKLGWYFKQEWRRYLLGVTFLLLVALVNLIPPKVIGDLVDAMSKSRSPAVTWRGCWGYCCFLGLPSIYSGLAGVMRSGVALRSLNERYVRGYFGTL